MRRWSALAVLLLAIRAVSAQPTPPDTAAAVRWMAAALDTWDAAARDRRQSLVDRLATGDAAPSDEAPLPAPIRLVTVLALAQHDAAPDPAAVAAASARVLTVLFPDAGDTLGARLADDLERLGPDTLGATRGRARAVLRLAAFPDEDDAPAVPMRSGDDVWTPLPDTTPDGIDLPSWRLLALDRADRFRPSPPPALGSPAFEAALDTVRQAARDRTAAQRRAARRWAGRSAFLEWNRIAVDALARASASEADAAWTLAQLNASFYDATVACFEAKYHYWTPRPSHLDASIARPFGVALPNFPAYPAGHGCSAGVAAEVLGSAGLLDADAAEVERLAHEMAASRLWAGVHYPFDNAAGVALGRAVAQYVAAHAARLALPAERP